MKLYDVIRKENIDRGKPLQEIVATEPQKEVIERRPSTVKFTFKKLFIVGLIAVFAGGLYFGGMKLVRVKVVVNERHIPFTLDNQEFELIHERDASTGKLSFQAMVVPSEITREVYGSNVVASASFAKGKVVFFNEYSKSAQTVKAMTVLTATNGKKYQTTTAVTVPGYTLTGTKRYPGTSQSVTIIATGSGDTYNTEGASFIVTGWTGTKAKQFYAQSAGVITGGEIGAKHSVGISDQSDIIATLNSQLLERLKRETRAQIPDTLISYPDLQFTSIDSNSVVLTGNSIKFPASIKGTMVSYLISRDLLESTIASKVLHDKVYSNVTIPSINNLVVVPITPIPTDPNTIPESIKVKISGSGTIITKVPLGTILQAVLGRPKKDFNQILANIPEVDSAEYYFFPFWAPYFPQNQNRITIEVK